MIVLYVVARVPSAAEREDYLRDPSNLQVDPAVANRQIRAYLYSLFSLVQPSLLLLRETKEGCQKVSGWAEEKG